MQIGLGCSPDINLILDRNPYSGIAEGEPRIVRKARRVNRSDSVPYGGTYRLDGTAAATARDEPSLLYKCVIAFAD